MRKIICWIFGHNIDLITTIMNEIKRGAVNSADLRQDAVRCLRCKIVLSPHPKEKEEVG